MPPVSEAQRKAMEAAAHGHSDLGIPKSVGEEFVTADDAPRAAGILYLNAGRALLILRGADAGSFPNTWGFPAGHIEDGESPLLAAMRESQEEVGFAPNDLVPLMEADGFVLFLARDCFTPVLNDESAGYVWAPVDCLPQPLHPGVSDAITLAIAKCALEAPAMDERAIDTNGWAEIKKNPISKAGVFEYRGSQIPGSPNPDKMYRVLRPEEELNTPEAVDSFKLLPWIDNHVMLGDGDGLMPAEKKGVQGVIGQDVHFQDDTLYGNLKVFSGALADLIEAGKRELSCGYRCTYDWTPGVWNGQPYDAVQRNIRGNHIALVKNGRMGPDVAVLDHSDTDRFVFTCDSTFEVNNMADEIMKPDAEAGAGNEGASLQDLRDQFAAFLPKLDEVLKIAAAVKAALGEEEAAAPDAEGSENEAEDAEGTAAAAEAGAEREENASENAEAKDDKDKTPAMDEAALARAVSIRFAARDKIASRLAKHVGTFDSSAMDAQEVAEYGVRKIGIKGVQKGHEMTALDVYLTSVKAPSERPSTTGTAMDSGNWLTKQRAAFAH
ncbi:DUF2213 domain-containing protein [Agrobacterium rhizogenes]|nr:DUF2213 domain-containing protein [Rhizobium rhizogenes]